VGMPSKPKSGKSKDEWWQISFMDQNRKPFLRHSSIEPFLTFITVRILTIIVATRYSQTCVPYTEWRGWKNKVPLAVWIHDLDSEEKRILQQLSYLKASSNQTELPKGTPRYIFQDPDDTSNTFEAKARKKMFFDFQSTIYDKVLVDIFDIDRIESTRRGEEASKQQLKLWLDHEGASAANSCLTFFANNTRDKRHLKFQLSWFDLEGLSGEERVIKLDFLTTSTKNRIKSRVKKQMKLQKAATFETQDTSEFIQTTNEAFSECSVNGSH